jgi:putative cell wall-binding protein
VLSSVAKYASQEVRRISGPTRFDTAAEIAKGFNAPAPAVYVASGYDWPDALTGGAAIGGSTGGPMLLVTKDTIPDPIKAQLDRLKPGQIFLLGGLSSVSDTVLDALKPYSANEPIRIAGNDRYDTSIHVASAFSAAPIVYLATGASFADAMAAGATAGAKKGPILLVPHDCIPFDADLTIQRLNPEQVIVLGGTASLGDGVKQRHIC